MPITMVGTTQTGGSGGSSSAAVAVPSGVAVGDILVAAIASNSAQNINATGWTRQDTTTNGFQLTLAYRYVTSGNVGDTSITFTNASGGIPLSIVMAAYRGVASSTPFSAGLAKGGDAGSSEPMSFGPLSASFQGKALAFRASRFTSSVTASYSDTDAQTTLRGQASYTNGVPVTMSVCMFDFTNLIPAAGSVSASISMSGGTEGNNTYFLAILREDAIPVDGTFAAQTPSITSDVAATRMIPTGDITSAIPSIQSDMIGTAAPPSGYLDTHLPSITSDFAATSIGGALAAALPKVTTATVGGVEQYGPLDAQLPRLSVSIDVETTPFGENVLRVDREDRAFKVTDNDTGLTPMKRSKVTNL